MQRKELLDKVALVSPALASNDLVPVLSHVWFTGTTILAYNDQIAISAPFKTDFKGAVPGATFASLLKNSKAKDVELEVYKSGTEDGAELLIKAASSRFKLPILPSSDFVFEMPKVTAASTIPVKGLVAGIKECLRSVSTDTSAPDHMGVTLIPNEGKLLQLFSTNNSTISAASIAAPAKLPFKRAVLPSLFCQQMVSIASSGKEGTIEINEEHTLFSCGGVMLYGRPISVDKPMPFVETVQAELPKNYKASLVSIPTKLQLMIERAIIITDSAAEQTTTTVSVKEGKMRFASKSSRGEVFDTMMVEPNQKDVTLSVHCKHLKAGYGAFDKMLLTETCFIMTKGDSFYLVGAVG